MNRLSRKILCYTAFFFVWSVNVHFSNDEYLLANSAYASFLSIVPIFKKQSDTELCREDKQFNYLYAQARVRPEHCIDILKARFQCLRELQLPIRVNAWVKVCCILRNFLFDTEDGIDDN
jgi:hypothetical protein